jgi:uncharacterized membrane protein
MINLAYARSSFPSPGEVAEYEKVIPGAGNRLLALAATEAHLRQSREREMQLVDRRIRWWVLLTTLCFGAGAAIFGYRLAETGSEIGGLIIAIGGPLSALISAVVTMWWEQSESS